MCECIGGSKQIVERRLSDLMGSLALDLVRVIESCSLGLYRWEQLGR